MSQGDEHHYAGGPCKRTRVKGVAYQACFALRGSWQGKASQRRPSSPNSPSPFHRPAIPACQA